MFLLVRFLIFLFLSNQVYSSGSGPVLIKMGDKKSGKKGGNLILISGGKCGSPTLIKGGGKKGGGEMILVGGQNNCEEKKQVHVVKQLVPVPYYIPKPVYKYILRHHYVPVRQYIMKPVPIPYPMKSYSRSYGESSYGGGGYGGGEYDSSSGYGAASSSTYDSEGSAYQSGKYYSGTSNYDMSYDSSNGGSNANANPSSSGPTNVGYKRQSYDSTPYSVSPQSLMMDPIDANGPTSTGSDTSDYQNGAPPRPSMGPYKSATTNSYYFESPSSSYGQFSSGIDSITPASNGNYHLYAPVYSGPNGQLFTTNQVFNDTSGSGASSILAPATSVTSTTAVAYSGEPTSLLSNPSTSSSMSSHSLPHDFLRIRESSLDRSSQTQSSSSSLSSVSSSKKKTKSVAPSSYKVDLERAKKLLTDPFSSIASLANGLNDKK